MADKIEPFDKARRKPAGKSIDLNAPFFQRRTEPLPDYSKCDHTRLGFEYSVKYRKVYCKCGEEVEPFDAIVAMGNSALRMQDAADTIKEERRRKEEEKAKRPFVKETMGFRTNFDRSGRVALSRTYNLECGHTLTQHRGRGFKRHWKKATCAECFRASQLKAQGVTVVGHVGDLNSAKLELDR